MHAALKRKPAKSSVPMGWPDYLRYSWRKRPSAIDQLKDFVNKNDERPNNLWLEDRQIKAYVRRGNWGKWHADSELQQLFGNNLIASRKCHLQITNVSFVRERTKTGQQMVKGWKSGTISQDELLDFYENPEYSEKEQERILAFLEAAHELNPWHQGFQCVSCIRKLLPQ